MNFEQCISEIQSELDKAVSKFPTWPTDPFHASCVIGEELGELTQAILQTTYEPDKSNIDDVRKEAIQTATMAIRFLLSLEEYKFAESVQHEQKL